MLLTKIHISTPGIHTVHRSELFQKLSAGLKTKLTLISAPAGFGKTTLVSDWIIQQDIPAAWYSIDSSDNDTVGFLSYMITAIQGLFPGYGENTLKLLHSPNQVNKESIVQLLINEILSLSEHFIFVLDDFHLIHNQEILNLFTYFIEHLPQNIHFTVLTRADPLLPIAKLRSQHLLVELRSTDLSFSVEEIHYLLNKKLKLKLSFADIQSLASKTEGWIAGLQLIALSLQGQDDRSAFIQNFKGDHRYIMDYLIEEVLKIQTTETKEFLLQTSLLKQLSGPLCDAVLDGHGSQAVLEMLEKNNVFIISLDGERKWYRYHHLFADLLKQRLLLGEKSKVKQLHSRASSWFEKNQMYPLAIEHALQIQNHEKAILLLTEEAEQLWKSGHHASIMKYGDMLPEDTIKSSPEFSLYYAWVLTTAGQIEKAGRFLTSAEIIARQEMTGENAGTDQKMLLGKIAVAIAYQHSFLNKPDIILDYCRIALENLSDDDPLWFSWGWYSVGMAQLANEDIFESTESLKKALEFGKKSGNIYLISTIGITLGYNEGRLGLYKISYKRSADLLEFLKEKGYADLVKSDWTFAVLFANMAAIQYFWGDLDGAYEKIKIAYDLCIQEANITSKVLVLVIYSVLLHGQGDPEGAEIKLRELEALIQKNKIAPFLKSMYIGWKATFLIIKKEPAKAHDFLAEHGVRSGKKISYAEEYCYIPYALLLMSEYKFEEASRLLSQLYDMASAQNRIERMIEIKVFFAIVHQAKGEKDEALDSLNESLSFAAPDEILMYHLNYLDQIQVLLTEIFKNHARGKGKLPNQFINKLKFAIDKRRKVFPGNLRLTTRELETLQLMAEDLSNQEIADQLFISLNTVKTRLKSLYIKLEVNNRTKAVAKAREFHLL